MDTDKEDEENLFQKGINSIINKYYVYGGIILIIMIVIYFTFSIHNLSNITNEIKTVEKNYSRYSTGIVNNNIKTPGIDSIISNIFSEKNLQIIILVSYFLLILTFLFLYNREKKLGYLNLFTNKENQIKENMGIPIANLLLKMGYVFGGMSLLIIVVVLVLWIYNSFSKLQTILHIILTILSFTIILSIVYIIFKNEIDRIINIKTNNLNFFENIIKIITQFIFLIPCLLIIVIDVIKDQIKITTPTIWIVLIIEIIIICLYFFIPFAMKYLNIHDGKILLEGPVYINEKRMIGTYQNVQKYDIFRKKIEDKFHFSLFKEKKNYNTFDISNDEFAEQSMPFNITIDLEQNNTPRPYYTRDSTGNIITESGGIPVSGHQRFRYNYNYAVSLAIYLNPQPVNTSKAYVVDTTIFDYANKPKIVYNGLEQQLKFICSDINNLEKTIYSTNDIKYQKWMNIVVNYRSGIVDIFIDGTLRATETNIQPFMDYSKIYVGSNNGIAGGIKNVIYFDKPLELNMIKYLNNFT